MNPIESFLSALSEIAGTGSFHSAGAAPFFFPGLRIEGLGEVAFPLNEPQVRALVALAEAAPYGQGTRTVFDEAVRKCWQLDAAQFAFDSPQWGKFLKQTLATISEDLGIRGQISASPYKLLIYGKGGHFKAHKDTEKLDAMFGTLVIALPSKHEGGRLFIRHDGREIEVDFSREEQRHDFQHAAFFADCEHEVEPVRSGYRCLPVESFVVCDTALWAALLKAFGTDPFEPAFKALLEENPENNRRSLFQILTALTARKDAARLQPIADRLASLAPKAAQPHYRSDRRDPIPSATARRPKSSSPPPTCWKSRRTATPSAPFSKRTPRCPTSAGIPSTSTTSPSAMAVPTPWPAPRTTTPTTTPWPCGSRTRHC